MLLNASSATNLRVLAGSRAVLSMALGLALYAGLPTHHSTTQDVPIEASVLAPDYISNHDRALYQQLFAHGTQADAAQVHAILANIDNKVLAGHVLANVYLGGAYRASQDELVDWLANYADHADADKIRALAAARGADASTLALIEHKPETLRGDGYIDHAGKASMPDGWFRALSAWKSGEFATAAKGFSTIGDNKTLSGWQRAAGYFWAARADETLGNRRMAGASLKKAAAFSTTFYGILAAHTLGDMADIAAEAPAISSAVRNDPHAVRARALASIGELSRAETELRQLYTTLDPRDRAAVVALAAELNLANLQVRLATLKTLSDEEKIFAAYPMPRWLTHAQSAVDPALLLAIARQESVFREDVTSQAGAVGMMQMLPSTARMMMSGLKNTGVNLASTTSDTLPMAEQLTNPQLNIRLGAAYVRHLMAQPYVGNNLVKVLAAYNAGPGSVSMWQKTAAKITDPLLYIESIPYGETRNYVMQVMAHYWVYQRLMGTSPHGLDALAAGDWPVV